MKSKGEILAAILTNFRNCCFFLHNTRELSVAEKILRDGFIFENQLVNSTDRVNPNEPIEITYFLFQRKDYGPFTVVIAIPMGTFEEYSEISVRYAVNIEEILTITTPYSSDNDEMIYTVSPKHILGYFNNNSGDFIQNSLWDISFNNCMQDSPDNWYVKHSGS